MLKAFFKNSFIYTIGTVLTRGIGILLVPIYTRYLTPAEYGVIDLFIILTSIISLTIALEIHQAVVRFYQETENEKMKIQYVSTAFLFTIFVYVIYLCISINFSNTFTIWLLDDIKYKSVFLLATLATFTSGLFYFTSGQLKWQIMPKQSVLVSIINVIIVSSIAVYLIVIKNMKVESIFIGQIVGNSVGIVLSLYYTKKSYQFVFVYEKFKELIHFSYPLVFSSVAIFIALFIDRIAIKYFLGFEELGIYGLAYRFAAVTSLVMIGFQSSLSPLIYKHYKEKETPENIVKLFEVFWLFVILVTAGSILFSKELIVLMSTKDFYTASPIIPLLVMAVFFTNMYIFIPGLSIAKKTKIIATISILGAILNTGLNFLLIPLFGIEGAGFATLTSAVIIFVLRVKMSQKYYLVPFKWIKIIFCFLIVISSSYSVIYFFDRITLLSISLKVIFILILIGISSFVLIEKEDLQKIRFFRKKVY